MMRTVFILIALVLTGCPQFPDAPTPSPLAPPDTDLCGKMCEHIGPEGLKCEEGESVYDSDVPGPVDVPNVTCKDFCETSQERGAFMNPRCVSLAPSCDKIEQFRQRDPDTCG